MQRRVRRKVDTSKTYYNQITVDGTERKWNKSKQTEQMEKDKARKAGKMNGKYDEYGNESGDDDDDDKQKFLNAK